MVVAYPANRNKKGKRSRTVLHFHLMPDSRFATDIRSGKRRIRTESTGMDGGSITTGGNGDATEKEIGKEDRRANHERMMTMFAAKLRDTWVHAITTTLFPDEADGGGTSAYPSMSPGECKRLLVIINPYSGKKNAQAIANRSLLPMLQQAGMEYEVLLTRHAGHAREVVRQEASDRWKGIVCISGDGLMYEVMNGLFDRADWREALECLAFGVVPAGSGNGLTRSLLHLQREQYHSETHDLSAAVNAARGSTRPMDLMYVETPMYGRLSFLHLSWGLISDIDIDSEVIRWMGSIRFTIYALLKIIQFKTYRGRLSYIPCDPEYTEDTKQILDELHHKDIEEMSNPDVSSSEDSNLQTSLESSKRSSSNKKTKSSPSPDQSDRIENDSLASDDDEESIIGHDNGQQKMEGKAKPQANGGNHYHRQNNSNNRYTGYNEEDASLPHAQPPGTYLIPRHVTYGTMLAQGKPCDTNLRYHYA